MKNAITLVFWLVSLLTVAQLPGNLPQQRSQGIAQTVMTRYPSALTIPFKPWCYPQGYFLMGIDKLWRSTGEQKYYDYMINWANEVVRPDGSLVYFKGRSMDDMMAGAVIVWAYQQTKEEKFRKAADIIRKSYNDYPRTSDSIFWHGRGTVGQIWVDGVFMGQMFLTKYGRYIGDSEYCFNEAARQIIGMHTHLIKGNSGLLYHGWDEDKDARWANRETGLAPEVWSEGLGWYALILVETLEIFPKNHPQYQTLVRITQELMAGLKKTQDAQTGLWFQVVDKGDQPGNWNETSGSGMFIFAMQRAIELGLISENTYKNTIDKGYQGLLTKARISSTDGLIDLYDANNGLGIQTDYETYVTRPKKMNGQEVISSFLWATWIVENRNKK
ncbi:MAG TPA: glycoside hydrolase family 88 protein [Bacteroidales bacterium]|nr:glycoside hydrolase family 88 protein [Bacteroidales bacterium]